MKGEYVKQENDNNKMFPKFPHQPPPQIFPPPHLHPPFPDSATPTPPSKKPKTTSPSTTTSNEDGGTIEIPRRPRGRPPGSKNKPKPPIFITREPEPVMSPYILELQSGADIVDSLTRFTRRRGVGLCVLTATGAVADVTLKQPSSSTPAGTVTFHGRFDILSLSAAVIVPPAPYYGGGGFTISLAGPQGQIIGGKVVGALLCSGIVYVTAASFNNPTYCRLPLDEEGKPPPRVSEHNNRSDDNEENSPVEGGGDGSGGGTMTLYGGHLGGSTCSAATDEVIWATPTSSRPPY